MPISILKFDILNKLEELIIGKILYIEFPKKETESLILDSYKFKKAFIMWAIKRRFCRAD